NLQVDFDSGAGGRLAGRDEVIQSIRKRLFSGAVPVKRLLNGLDERAFSLLVIPLKDIQARFELDLAFRDSAPILYLDPLDDPAAPRGFFPGGGVPPGSPAASNRSRARALHAALQHRQPVSGTSQSHPKPRAPSSDPDLAAFA